MKTSSCKAKGRQLQQFVASVLVRVAKTLDPDDVVSRPMGSAGSDLMLSPKAQALFPISMECKNTKTFPSVSALVQSRNNKYPNTLPSVVWKPFGKGMEESIVYFNYVEFVEFFLKEKTNGST